jgi:hypothetical protein
VAYWIKLTYDRNVYLVDLDLVSAFCYTRNGRVSFSILDGIVTVVINQQSDPVTYQAILDYVKQTTGLSFP